MLQRIVYLFLCLFGLTACSTTDQAASFNDFGKPLGNHHLSRSQHYNQSASLQNWTIRGEIAVHNQQKGWNASFNWQQQPQGYQIQLFGPLGTNRIQIAGNANQVTLRSATRFISARTPEQLIQQELGWSIPVSNLTYWLKGIPAPGISAKQSFDLNNHIAQMSQEGWRVVYLRYIAVNGVDLPNRILLSNPYLQIRLIISQWDI